MDIRDLICCDEYQIANYAQPCDTEKRIPTDYYNAVAFVENINVPKVGDSILIGTETVLLTETNFAMQIIRWIKDVQFKCGYTDSTGKVTKGKITFLTHNQIKGTAPVPTFVQGNAMFDGSTPPPVSISNKITYTLADAWANTDFLNHMIFVRKQLSIINFTNTTVEVLRKAEDNTKIMPSSGGNDMKGDGKPVSGNLVIDYTRKQLVVPQLVPIGLLDEYAAELDEPTAFTFHSGTGFTDTTGNLVKLTCSKFSTCLQYTVPVGAAFSFKNLSDQDAQSSCINYQIFANCTDSLPTDGSVPVLINSNTGEVKSTGLSEVGKTYKFTVALQNECGVMGSYCIELTVI